MTRLLPAALVALIASPALAATHAPCPADTTLDAGTGGTIYDTAGNAWTITAAGQVAENGTVLPNTWQVAALFWNGSQLDIENTAGAWYNQSLSGGSATPLAGAPSGYVALAAATPLPQSSFAVELSGDAYNGPALAEIMVDNTVVAPSVPVTAVHASNQWQVVSWMGNYGLGTHIVKVIFLNDLYGGSPTKDRNLYFAAAVVDGHRTVPSYTDLPGTGDAGWATVTTEH